MATLKVIIDNTEIELLEEGFLEYRPMPEKDDPNWIDPEDGTRAPQVDKYPSSKAWAAAYLAEHLVKISNKGLNVKANRLKTAIDASKVTSEV